MSHNKHQAKYKNGNGHFVPLNDAFVNTARDRRVKCMRVLVTTASRVLACFSVTVKTTHPSGCWSVGPLAPRPNTRFR